MALSPLAALALPMATDPTWRESAALAGDRLRERLQAAAQTDGAKQVGATSDAVLRCSARRRRLRPWQLQQLSPLPCPHPSTLHAATLPTRQMHFCLPAGRHGARWTAG
jgi:hypothetical protein